MSEKDALDLIELLYPYFIKKYKEDTSFKQTAQVINATVVSQYNNKKAEVKINPYDTTTIQVKVGISENLQPGDSVLVMFNESLKNARIIAKN